MEPFKQRLEFGRSLFDEARYIEAVEHFATFFPEYADRVEFVRTSAQAVVAALTRGDLTPAWVHSNKDDFFFGLISQERLISETPILHQEISGQHSAGAKGLIEKAADVFGPTIKIAIQSNKINKNVTLIVIILRKHISQWVLPAEASRLHLEWLSRFTIDDLRLAYNCMFDKIYLADNKTDAIEYISSTPFDQYTKTLSLYHLVFYSWLAGGQRQSQRDGERLTDFAIGRLAQPSLSKDDIAAAKALVLRHWTGDQSGLSDSPSGSGIDAEFVKLADDFARSRARLAGAAKPIPNTFGVRHFNSRPWQGYQAIKSVARNRILLLRSRRRNLRIAVNISGQLRGYQAAFRSWQQTFLAGVDYDLFIHSWQRIGRSGAEPFRTVLPFEGQSFIAKYREVSAAIGFDAVRARYPSLFRELNSTGAVTEAQIANFYQSPNVLLEDDTQPPFSDLTNQEKMHRKIFASYSMLEKSGKNYDLIVRIRPDKLIRFEAFDWSDLHAVCRDNRTIFSDIGFGTHFGHPMIGDQFAVGSPEAMRVYSSAWNLFPRFASKGLFECPSTFQGHVSLAYVCWLHGIDVKKMPMGFGPLADPERLSSSSILHCLQQDAEGRMDQRDRLLIDAISADMRHPAR